MVRLRLPQLHRGGALRRRRLPRGGAVGHGGGARAHGAGGGGDTEAEVKTRVFFGGERFLINYLSTRRVFKEKIF